MGYAIYEQKIRIHILAHPKSRREEILKKDENTYEIWVREAPEEGKANQAILRLLSRHLGVPRSRFLIRSGLRSKNKWIEIAEH